MLDSNQNGYAVMTPDKKGVGLCDERLETCKEYCRNGDIIVKVSPKHHGYIFKLYFSGFKKEYPVSLKWTQKHILWLNWSIQRVYLHSYGEEVYRSGE